MTPAFITLLNGLILVTISLIGYLGSDTPSPTALIPAAFGFLFVVLYPLMKKGNKAVAHIVVVLTLLLIIALVKPLTGALGRDDSMAAIRVGIMIATSVFALIVYIRSFVAARSSRG